MEQLSLLKEGIVTFASLTTRDVLTLASVECAGRPAMVLAGLLLHSLLACYAGARVHHASTRHFSTGELLGGALSAGVAVILVALVLLTWLVVELQNIHF